MKKRIVALAIATLALIGCGKTSDSTTDNPTPDSTVRDSSTTDGNNGGTSDSVASEYNIIAPDDSRYTVTVSGGLTKAKKGDSVTITVTPSAGFTIKAVFVDSSEITGNNGTYTFTMPGHDIRITATLSVEGDVTIQGGVTAVLTLGEDGIYVAKDVLVSSDSDFSYFIKGASDTTELDSGYVDRTKTLADINPAYNSEYKLSISGGFKYDFYYDPSAKLPCYIRRSEVVSLPDSQASLEKLFAGSIKSENSETLLGLKHVTYTNTRIGVSYDWKRYDNNSSLATIKDTTNSSLADKYVYKELNDGIYTIVDTFDRGSYDVDAWELPYWARSDKTAFSGHYVVGDYDLTRDRNTETSTYDVDYDVDYMNEIMAEYDLNRSDIDMETIDFDIDSAYRVQMTVQDEITYVKCDISSVTNADGSFTTTVDSARVYDATAVSQNASYGITDKYYDIYSVSLTFTKAGEILSGTYKDTRFDENSYTLVGNTVTISGKGTVRKELNFAYEYGDAYESLQAFDTTPYFVSSIDPTIRNEDVSTTENIVSIGDVLEKGREVDENFVTLNYAPSTALDAWQYHVVSSDNTDIFRWDPSYVQFAAYGDGKANLTVGTFHNKGVSKTISVTSRADYSIRNIWLDHSRDGTDLQSEYAYAYEGEKTTYTICATAEAQDSRYNTSGTVIIPSDLTFDIKNKNGNADTSGLKISYERKGKYNSTITFDATDVKISEDTVLYVTINSSMYATDYTTSSGTKGSDSPSVITVYLYEMDNAASVDTIQGTWNYVVDGNVTSTLNFTKTDSGNTSYPYRGTLVSGGTTYAFSYAFDSHQYDIKLKFDDTSITSVMRYIDSDDEIDCVVYKEVYSMSGSEITDILGTTVYDEDSYEYDMDYVTLVRSK